MTKRYKTGYVVFKLLSVIAELAPVIVGIVMSFATPQATQSAKITLAMCIVIAGIIALVNLVFKYHIKSAFWFIILGINACIGKMQTLLLITAISCIIDEFILTPLYKHYKEKYSINKEIDKRLK